MISTRLLITERRRGEHHQAGESRHSRAHRAALPQPQAPEQVLREIRAELRRSVPRRLQPVCQRSDEIPVQQSAESCRRAHHRALKRLHATPRRTDQCRNNHANQQQQQLHPQRQPTDRVESPAAAGLRLTPPATRAGDAPSKSRSPTNSASEKEPGPTAKLLTAASVDVTASTERQPINAADDKPRLNVVHIVERTGQRRLEVLLASLVAERRYSCTTRNAAIVRIIVSLRKVISSPNTRCLALKTRLPYTTPSFRISEML